MNRIELFRYKGSKEWGWHIVAPNGRRVATAGESFTRKWSAKRAARGAFPGGKDLKVVTVKDVE